MSEPPDYPAPWRDLTDNERLDAHKALTVRLGEEGTILHEFLDGFARGMLHERAGRAVGFQPAPLLAEAVALEYAPDEPRYTLREAQEIQEQIVREVSGLLGVAQIDVLNHHPHLLADDGDGVPIRPDAFLRTVDPGWTDSVDTHLARAFARALVLRIVADGPVRLHWVPEDERADAEVGTDDSLPTVTPQP